MYDDTYPFFCDGLIFLFYLPLEGPLLVTTFFMTAPPSERGGFNFFSSLWHFFLWCFFFSFLIQFS